MTTYSGIEDVLPLTPLQSGLHFHAAYDRESRDAYAVQTTVELEGAVDPAALRAACDALVARHAALRTAFRQVADGRTVQVVATSAAAVWTYHDLRGLPDTERAGEASRIAGAEHARRFDLAVPSLVRFTLIRPADTAWQLVLTYHHIILDGWSLAVLLGDLLALYGSTGAELPAPVGSRGHLEWLAAQDQEEALSVWRKEMAGLARPCRVAATPAAAGPLPGWTELSAGAELTSALTHTARATGVTLNTLVQTAWALLLAQLTGSEDVVFGATVSGRAPEIADSDRMVGLLANTVPVRFTIEPAETVTAALRRLHAAQVRLMPHQHLGLATLRRVTGPEELFDTAVVFESYPLDPDDWTAHLPQLRVARLRFSAAGHYPLALIAVPGPELALRLEYRPDLFPDERARDLAGRLLGILAALATAPDQPVGRIDPAPPDERRLLLDAGHGPEPRVAVQPLSTLFEARVAATPAATALICGTTEWSYQELNARANRLARLLVERGAGPERVVAIALPRGAEAAVALLAASKAGAAFFVMDCDHPRQRLASDLVRADPVVVVIDAASARSLPASSRASWLRQDDPDVTARLRAAADGDLTDAERTAPLRAEHPAYLVFTSGSTGRPKAVSVTHTGIAELASALRVRADSRVMQFLSLSFDAALGDVLQSWLSGACLVLVESERRVAGPELGAFAMEKRITHAALTPTLLATLSGPGSLPDGTALMVGGEVCPARLGDMWSADHPLCIAFGPTEATVAVTLGAPRRGAEEGPPLGRPLPGVRAYVLDGLLRPVPDGHQGELYLGGRCLARGYHGDPAGTAERFVADPFGSPGGRLYRTGDLVRRRSDGVLEYHGRVDDQVKIRGFRVEPGEVEAALSACPGTAQVAVAARPDPAGALRLVAYAVPARGQEITPGAVRDFARRVLPAHLVPSAVVVLEQLPMTATGKLDRNAVPAPGRDDPGPAAPASRPARGEREQVLCRLFSEVLGLTGVGPDDGFFDLGGDSLSATRLTGRIRAELGSSLPVRAVYDAPTPAGLAGCLETSPRRSRPALRPMR